mmetsp:Transcript_30763/g.27971  ORF Transcript_30763/g.27971 Transcript_30763/m.27971 type:complete len:99 (-) Transcript_30763:147-443(-)
MNKIILVVMLLAFVGRLTAFSCALGRFGCVPSCMAQNCATGYCENDVCTCSRCDNGSAVKGNIGVNVGIGFLVASEGGEEGFEGFEGFEGEEGGEYEY